jgi:hypothetical protein
MLNTTHKRVTLIKEVMWNEQMDGNELFDAVLKDEAGEVRVMRCCECFDIDFFMQHEWDDCITLEEYVVEYIDNWK